MRALGLTDAIFFNLGDRYITSTVVLDGPCDLPLFTAEMDAAARDYAPLRDRFRRIWPWFFAHPDPEFDIADHIVVLNAPGVTTLAQLEPVVEKIRRTRRRAGAPPGACSSSIRPPWTAPGSMAMRTTPTNRYPPSSSISITRSPTASAACR